MSWPCGQGRIAVAMKCGELSMCIHDAVCRHALFTAYLGCWIKFVNILY